MPHNNFQLWLIAEADCEFPTIFLNECIKISYEAPPGLRNNLKRTYLQLIQDESSTNNSRENLAIQFLLNFLHALLQERRNFIPQVVYFKL